MDVLVSAASAFVSSAANAAGVSDPSVVPASTSADKPFTGVSDPSVVPVSSAADDSSAGVSYSLVVPVSQCLFCCQIPGIQHLLAQPMSSRVKIFRILTVNLVN